MCLLSSFCWLHLPLVCFDCLLTYVFCFVTDSFRVLYLFVLRGWVSCCGYVVGSLLADLCYLHCYLVLLLPLFVFWVFLLLYFTLMVFVCCCIGCLL